MSMPNIRPALKKIIPLMLRAQERNLNEADTRLRILKVLSDVLGYDEMREVTSEQRLKDKYVDFAVIIDGDIEFLIEVKAANVKLRYRQIEQAEMYAAKNNYNWVLLTNGVAWHLYHLTFSEGIEYETAFIVDLATDTLDTATEALCLLHRQSIVKGYLEDFWQEKLALGPASLGRAIFTEDVLKSVRREVRRKDGILIDIEDLAQAIRTLFTAEARESMGPLKIRKAYKPKGKKK
ncbi:MAG: type I restriction enzyme HsdR N-terminal domain-containing protein [Candidatus Marinimicrobia bacterium]|nr:type I restriction enzyme HsdR N-terminal domain-containing protein [Candidatus Neomarinimicrobiota bacterium]